MSEIINLRRARKRLARADREADASANRAKFGRTKAERAKEAQEGEALRKTLDGAKREDP